MERYSKGAIWTLLLMVGILAAAGIGSTSWLRAAPAQSVRFSAVTAVWLNFGLQIVLLGIAVFIGLRFLRADRQHNADEARTRHLAEVALLSGGLAHEVRNHLHALQSRVGLLRKSVSGNAAALQRLEKLDEITEAMEQLLTNFLTFARPGTDELEDVDPAAVIREVVSFEQLDLEQAGIDVDLNLKDGMELYVDRAKLKRALLNVIVNARQAMCEGGRLSIRCEPTADGVQICVQDTGEGIDREVLPHVFDSFFTTKSDGSGLGLAIVKRTVEDFGGSVRCSSIPGSGTTIHLNIPHATGQRAPRHDDTNQPLVPGDSPL